MSLLSEDRVTEVATRDNATTKTNQTKVKPAETNQAVTEGMLVTHRTRFETDGRNNHTNWTCVVVVNLFTKTNETTQMDVIETSGTQ